MQKKHEFKSDEAREREKKHWFGQPNGNKQGDPRAAGSQRAFYAWCESEATEKELRTYAMDDPKPMARRKFVAALMGCKTVQDFFDLTNQTHGQPKQVIEQTNLPAVQIILE